MFARTHNMSVHISSVHKRERSHLCEHAGCERAFNRRHDLVRHFQSAHTNLGSPRNVKLNGGKKAARKTAKKAAKKDDQA